MIDQLPLELVQLVVSFLNHRCVVAFALTSEANVNKFAGYAESKTCRFKTGQPYASSATDWEPMITLYTVTRCVKDKGAQGHGFLELAVRKMHPASRNPGLMPRDIRMDFNGLEYINLGEDDKSPSLSAAPFMINMIAIHLHNNYWNNPFRRNMLKRQRQEHPGRRITFKETVARHGRGELISDSDKKAAIVNFWLQNPAIQICTPPWGGGVSRRLAYTHYLTTVPLHLCLAI